MCKYTTFLLIVVSISYGSISYAHPGSTNAEGCHNNKQTGKYHCHGSATEEPGNGCEEYIRNIWDYTVKVPALTESKNKHGFYTGMKTGEPQCNIFEADHVVSIHEAHRLGGCQWNAEEKKKFANDHLNLVPACDIINSSKGNATPAVFWSRSSDGKGQEYKLPTDRWCKYLERYIEVKRKYDLSFENNDKTLFKKTCGISIED